MLKKVKLTKFHANYSILISFGSLFFSIPKKEIFVFQVDLERGDKEKHFMDVQIKIVQFILTNIS